MTAEQRTLAPRPQYATLAQQSEAAVLGVWVFLATEVLFFGGLLLAYTVLRQAYPIGFAEGGAETKLVIGTANTAILLTSSATMAWAVHTAESGNRRALFWLLAITAAFGLAFLALKGLEYFQEYREGQIPGLNFTSQSRHAHAIELFYWLYFGLTGVHAAHVSAGIALVLTMAGPRRHRQYQCDTGRDMCGVHPRQPKI